MTKKQLVEVIGSGDKTYLYFFSPFCGGCEKTTPLVKESKIKTYEINGIENEELLNAFKIDVYPTIVEINGKSKRTYEGSVACKNLLS